MAWCSYYGTSLCDDSCSSYRDCPVDREWRQQREWEERLKEMSKENADGSKPDNN